MAGFSIGQAGLQVFTPPTATCPYVNGGQTAIQYFDFGSAKPVLQID